jgi:hypothetical protein
MQKNEIGQILNIRGFIHAMDSGLRRNDDPL